VLVVPSAGAFALVPTAGELDVEGGGVELTVDGGVVIWVLAVVPAEPQPDAGFTEPTGPALSLTPGAGMPVGLGSADGLGSGDGDGVVTGGEELTGVLDAGALAVLVAVALELELGLGAGADEHVAGVKVAPPPGLPPLPDEPAWEPEPVGVPPWPPPLPMPACGAGSPLCTPPSEEAVLADVDEKWWVRAKPPTATTKTAAPMAATGRTQPYRGRAAWPGRAAAGRKRSTTARKAAATGSSHRRRPAYQAEADSKESIGRLIRSRMRCRPSADGSIESAAACRARRRASS
jgi:hypothetical protein